MADVRSLEADVLICLGGVVCHGPNPQEIYDGNRAVTDHFVLGNHDAPAPPFLSISDLPNNVLRDTPKKANPLQSVSKNGDEGGRESTPLLPG
ncbi:metallophosphoesterase [Akkermansiaceae bacterium]|nr:metallophosphoesterase [Akkermansiaceae bacterium]MDB4290393.1 metallophosphoesterase [bacterium]MDC0287250.1 metallophosphoesterase [Akkermansiaceae bacterium]MDC1405131.1 metallophosphoesterase [Akkermansiaceae bacterium]